MKYDIPPEFKQFVAHVKRRCTVNKIELVMSPSRNVVITDSFSTDCSGYFDDVNRTLVVACGKPFKDWIEIMVHEYSHMEQWLTDERWGHWTDCCLDLWDWLDGDVELDEVQMKVMIDGMIELERDCEVRALENIRKWKLPINKTRYARKANLYLYSYRVMPIIKKFPTGLYDNKALIDMCPSRIGKRYETVPKDVMELIIKTYG
jgi:hypothetical protein